MRKLWMDFARSAANVMLLLGPPGTGKTTFIRGLIRAIGMQAWVTYDESVQTNEAFYTSFAGKHGHGEDGSDRIPIDYPHNTLAAVRNTLSPAPGASMPGRLMVLEDADAMLTSRDDGNKLMSRILNISDGLVSLPKRKIIFSTNLPNLHSIDEALLRPGRCFAALKFRKLTPDEAGAAVKAAQGIDRHFTGAVTLSEALNTQHSNTEPILKIGF